MALDDYLNPANLAGKIQRAPKLPVAGFWMRLIAFGLDWIILRLAFYGLALVFREPLLAAGPAAGIVSVLLIYTYFILGDGPLGKGRTLGKLLFGLRLIDAATGQAPTLRQAAIRNAVLLPHILVTSYLLFPLIPSGAYSPGVELFKFMMGEALFISLWFGQVVWVLMNPFRQGLHDRAANTLVLGMNDEPVPMERLEEQAGEIGIAKAMRASRAGWIAMNVIWVFVGYQTVTQSFLPATKNPPPREYVRVHEELRNLKLRVDYATAAEDGGTTATAAAAAAPGGDQQAPDGASVSPGNRKFHFEVRFLKRGRENRTPSEVRPELLKLVELEWPLLLRESQEQQAELRKRRADQAQSAAGAAPQPERPILFGAGSKVVFRYQEYLDLVLYQQGLDVLTETRVLPELAGPAVGDSSTTQTLVPASAIAHPELPKQGASGS